jgi:hypothetical protein
LHLDLHRSYLRHWTTWPPLDHSTFETRSPLMKIAV